MRPADGITEGGRAFASRIVGQRLTYAEENALRTPGDTLHHLGRIALIMVTHNLVDAAWMLQRRVARRRVLAGLGGALHEVLRADKMLRQRRRQHFALILPAIRRIAGIL